MHNEHHDSHGHDSSKIEDRITFFFVAVGVITITLGLFAFFDFLPEKPGTPEEEPSLATTAYEPVIEEEETEPLVAGDPLPVKIIIDDLKKEIDVLNPASNDIQTLDNALLSGVVRHPDSADLVNTGTIFILGHSSYLPNVINKNFQAFNGIQKLEWGDVIRLQSGDAEYVYSVDKVYEAKASDAEVPLQFDTAKLVLATCDSFGSKDDRFIVEASLVMKRPIPKS